VRDAVPRWWLDGVDEVDHAAVGCWRLLPGWWVGGESETMVVAFCLSRLTCRRCRAGVLGRRGLLGDGLGPDWGCQAFRLGTCGIVIYAVCLSAETVMWCR
jgi:hypothetical protein